MSKPPPFSQELRPYVDRNEAEAIDRVAEQLRVERPRPRPAFRAELRSRLGERAARARPWRPQRLRRLVAAYAGSGLLLLGVAVLGLAGAGPLAA